MKKALVAYFSTTGVTENLAKEIAKITKADLFQIKPMVPYTKADLDWTDKNARSTIEMQDPKSRPEIAETVSDIAEGIGHYYTVCGDLSYAKEYEKTLEGITKEYVEGVAIKYLDGDRCAIGVVVPKEEQ